MPSFILFNKSKIRSIAKILALGLLLFTCFYLNKLHNSYASTPTSYNGFRGCAGGTDVHRKNCFDIIDLPLCSDMKQTPDPASPQHMTGNCVKECKDINPHSQIENQPNQGHNVSCIRFCDSPDVDPVLGVNCVTRACHQLINGATPEIDPHSNISNCTLLPCNLLSVDELNNTKFYNSTYKWCEGSGVKCYEFARNKLPYVKYRLTNSMCEIHHCKPDSTTCGTDETTKITQRCEDPDLQNPDKVGDNLCKANVDSSQIYTNDYVNYINGNMSIYAGFCTPIICKPIVTRSYRCNDGPSGNATVPNQNCTLNIPCDYNGFCSQIIDCNKTENQNVTECQASTSGNISTMVDDTLAWLYRPRPSSNYPMDDKGILSVSNINRSDVCFTKDDIEANGWGTQTWIFGWWFSGVTSPGNCNHSKLGSRGNGYLYLCGVNGNLYSDPSSDAAYVDGYATADYTKDNPIYGLRVCLRFKNSGSLNACGSRECRNDCSSGGCYTQWCGADVCNNLTLSESNTDRCSLSKHNELFTDSGDGSGCSQTVDHRTRVRIGKYGRRMCAFLDFQGTLAYSADYLNGKEYLDDGATCIDGENDSSGQCNGFDTNSSPGTADKWRSVKLASNLNTIPYVLSPGYTTLNGRYFKTQQCALIPLRVGPPRFYNIATAQNSSTLFSPPLYILDAKTIRGGPTSAPQGTNQYGSTNFYYPEIEVKFGLDSQLMSLGFGQDKINDTTKLTTTTYGVTSTAEVYVRKEFDKLKKQPIFCLYRRFINGNDAIDIQVGCVNRNMPEINYSNDDESVTEKAIISLAPGSTYDNSSINLKMEYKNTGIVNNATAIDSKIITLKNATIADINSDNYCKQDIEQHKFCALRDVCSQLYSECVTNEINLHNAILNNTSVTDFMRIKENCEDSLLNSCNKKKGAITSGTGNIFTQTIVTDPYYYGWFNEICIASGFETKLRQVLAYKVDNNVATEHVLGKCLIDPILSAQYNSKFNPQECSNSGGRFPDCVCKEWDGGDYDKTSYEVRTETPHEAGLCVNMDIPTMCPAIDYTPTSPSNDPNFILSSLNMSSYGSTYNDVNAVVHISHKYRSDMKMNGTDPAPTHAEFTSMLMGMVNVEGVCNGFWKPVTNSLGVELKPRMSCVAPTNGGSSATWDIQSIQNDCVRYSCPAITSAGVQSSGDYQNGYGDGEPLATKGSNDGYAYWPEYKKTNDFLEKVSATVCIPGFKPNKSKLIFASDGSFYMFAKTDGAGNPIQAPNPIGYVPADTPVRNCNQLGNWDDPRAETVCQRIYCDAITPPAQPNSTSQPDINAWLQAWRDSRGASFPSVPASRSNSDAVPALSESISQGTCNNSLGYFNAANGLRPTRECDYLGRWKDIQNPCVSDCNAVDAVSGNNLANGFATWSQAWIPSSQTSITVQGSCLNGYIPNPYYGAPTRTCSTKSITDNGQTVNKVDTWDGVKNLTACINSCLGGGSDPVHGNTDSPIYNTSLGITFQQINWPDTPLGSDAYYQSPGCSTMDASIYRGTYRNCFRAKRHCDTQGKWSDPVEICVINNGTFDHVILNSLPSIDSNSGQTVTGQCIDKWRPFNNGATPVLKCLNLNYNGQQILNGSYLAYTNGTQDCEEITCPIAAGATNPDGGTVVKVNQLLKADDKITASCSDGWGYAITGGSNPVDTSDLSKTCGMSPNSDRNVGIPPTITCGRDAQLHYENICSKCRNCTSDSSSLPTNPSQPITASNGCVSESRTLEQMVDRNPDTKNVISGYDGNFGFEYFEYHCYSGNKGVCLIAEAKCVDGYFQFVSNKSHNDGCP